MAYDTQKKDTVVSQVRQVARKTWYSLMRIVTPSDTLWATGNHPFYIPALQQYLPADSLRRGMQLLALTGALLTVQSVAAVDTTVSVYNFEVAEHHNYYVGEEGVLVHNTNGTCPLWRANLRRFETNRPAIVDATVGVLDLLTRQALELDLRTALEQGNTAFLDYFTQGLNINSNHLDDWVPAAQRRVRAWAALSGTAKSTDLAWLEQMERWIGLDVTFTRTNGIVRFTAPNGFQFAKLDGDDLYFIYPGFGGDILVKPDRVTTVLGKWQERTEDPNSLGTWIYLSRNGGLSDGIISRVINNSPPYNSIAFLDLPGPQYNSLINNHIRDQILLFDGNSSNLHLITTQDPWGVELRDIIQTQILPNATNEEITAILEIGRNKGKQEFWLTYNLPYLEAAFQRGDDIRLVSNPAPNAGNRTGFYADELDEIETRLIQQYNYQYNPTTKTYEKQ